METTKATKYIEAIGRRKTSSARVRLQKGTKGSFTVNDRPMKEYFPTVELQDLVNDAFKTTALEGAYNVSVMIKGGGIHSQAEAVRLGIARALTKTDGELRKPLKKADMLTRDPRAKERRKFGLKKARKAPTWSKR